MKVICLTCNTIAKFMWTTVENLSLSTSSRLVIQPKDNLGENYKFNVSVQSGKGFATIEMFTPKAINETCTVFPLEGTESFTEFTLACTPNRTDSQLPFIYMLFQGGTKLLSSNNRVFTSKLNAANDVKVRIQDSYGQYLLVQIKITIKKTTALSSIEEISDIFTSKNSSLDLKRMITDGFQSNALVFINTVASRLNVLKPDEGSDIVSQILDVMDELRIDHFDGISPVTQTLTNLLQPIRMNHKIALKCTKILDKISSALRNNNVEVSASDYVTATNGILSVVNQLIDPFETIPPVQNVNALISHEYHEEDYEYYGVLDFGIFEKLDNLESITLSVEKTVNGLATCAAKLFQPMEDLGEMSANDIQVKVLVFDEEVASDQGNRSTINGTTAAVTVSYQSNFHNESSISCTFFNKSPMWWFSDGIEINSDVVGVSIYRRGAGIEENVSGTLFFVRRFSS